MKKEFLLLVAFLAILSLFFLSGNALGTMLLYENWEDGIDTNTWYENYPELYSDLGTEGSQAVMLGTLGGQMIGRLQSLGTFSHIAGLEVTSSITAISTYTTSNQYMWIGLRSGYTNILGVQHNAHINASAYNVGSEWYYDYDGYQENTYQNYTFVINDDLTISFFLDGVFRWKSTNKTDAFNNSNVTLWLEGRSLGAKMLIDDIIVSDSPIFSYDPVPEPTTMLLLGTGLLGLAATRRRIRK